MDVDYADWMATQASRRSDEVLVKTCEKFWQAEADSVMANHRGIVFLDEILTECGIETREDLLEMKPLLRRTFATFIDTVEGRSTIFPEAARIYFQLREGASTQQAQVCTLMSSYHPEIIQYVRKNKKRWNDLFQKAFKKILDKMAIQEKQAQVYIPHDAVSMVLAVTEEEPADGNVVAAAVQPEPEQQAADVFVVATAAAVQQEAEQQAADVVDVAAVHEPEQQAVVVAAAAQEHEEQAADGNILNCGIDACEDGESARRRVITTPCGHTFCHHCITEHLCLRGNSRSCPICRQAIDTLRYEDGTVVEVVATADPDLYEAQDHIEWPPHHDDGDDEDPAAALRARAGRRRQRSALVTAVASDRRLRARVEIVGGDDHTAEQRNWLTAYICSRGGDGEIHWSNNEAGNFVVTII